MDILECPNDFGDIMAIAQIVIIWSLQSEYDRYDRSYDFSDVVNDFGDGSFPLHYVDRNFFQKCWQNCQFTKFCLVSQNLPPVWNHASLSCFRVMLCRHDATALIYHVSQ